MSQNALIILAAGFEEIEAITPIDLLRRAGIDVTIATLNPENMAVVGAHGIIINADQPLEALEAEFDAIILPGGSPGAENLAKSDRVSSLIKDMYAKGKLIAAICAAPALVLAPTGILDNRRATCFTNMENCFSVTTLFCQDSVVVDGNIITSRGAGTAFDFSLAIIEKLLDKHTADQLAEKTLAK